MILRTTDVTGDLARWRLQLSEFDFGVVPRAGVKLQPAEALSCLPLSEMNEFSFKNYVPVFLIT